MSADEISFEQRQVKVSFVVFLVRYVGVMRHCCCRVMNYCFFPFLLNYVDGTYNVCLYCPAFQELQNTVRDMNDKLDNIVLQVNVQNTGEYFDSPPF